MQRTLDQLKKECIQRGIYLDDIKYSRKDLIKKLATFSLEFGGVVLTKGLEERLKIESPMLCFSFKNLKEKEKQEILNSDEWIMEEKWNGCRCIIVYDPTEGFTFFSRNISVKDFLPEEFTNKVLLIKEGKVREPRGMQDFDFPFVLDAEVLVDKKDIDTRLYSKLGVVTGSELNACSAILAINAEASKKIQMEQVSLKFRIFDVLSVKGKDVTTFKLTKRLEILDRLFEVFGESLPFYKSGRVSGKEKGFQEIIKRGGEGVVFKNLNSPYVPTTSRLRDCWVKMKRSMSEVKASDVDVFISGFVPSDEKKGWGDFIGAIKVSVFLQEGDEQIEHWIGSVSGIPMELREKMTMKNPLGQIILNPEYLGRVLVVDGQSISSKNLRFTHCRCENWNFRTDKTKYDCVLEKEFLMSQVR